MQLEQSQASAPLNLPPVQEVLTAHVPIMDHVPRGCRVQWCEELTEVIKKFVINPNSQTLALVYMLPKVILADTERGGKRARRQRVNSCLKRLQQFKDGEHMALWELANSKTEHRKKVPKTPDQNATGSAKRARVLKILANKGVSKAAKEILSSGLHDVTPEIISKLEDLHPRVNHFPTI